MGCAKLDVMGDDKNKLKLAPFKGSTTGSDAVATRLTTAWFQQLIESRDPQFGAQAGFAFAEGCVVRQPVVRTHLLPDLSPTLRPDGGRR